MCLSEKPGHGDKGNSDIEEDREDKGDGEEGGSDDDVGDDAGCEDDADETKEDDDEGVDDDDAWAKEGEGGKRARGECHRRDQGKHRRTRMDACVTDDFGLQGLGLVYPFRRKRLVLPGPIMKKQ